MGYDVSFHPISPKKCGNGILPLTWVQQGQEEKVLALAAQHGIEDFYAEKYLDTLRVGAGQSRMSCLIKAMVYIAVVQGFFQDYYYTRGSSFSFLMEKKPEYARYFTPWAQVMPTPYPTRQKTRSLKTTAPACTCLPTQVLRILRDLSRTKGYWRIWRNIGAMGSLLF